jgi:hypothetical protein
VASQDYRALERRIRRLDRHLLPRSKTTYSPREYDGTRAYLLLCHAEVEHFIEERAKAIARNALTLWMSDRRPRKPLMALLTMYEGKFTMTDTLATRLNKTVVAFEFAVGNNHGVKEDNVLSLLLPVGIDKTDLDPLWLNEMNTFGTRRGIVAHQAAHAVRSPPDPDVSRAMVGRVLTGLEDVDGLVRPLVR